MAAQELIELLKTQSDNYSKALELELELAGIIAAGEFPAMSANTECKNRLMASINRTYETLLPLMEKSRVEGAEGRLADPECEKLRLQAIELLQKIGKLEAENLEAIKKSRDESVAALKQTSTARRVARGYRPSGGSHRYLDTKS
jgi:uncharacterized protein with von Willebrand factor type A (vWA) domain